MIERPRPRTELVRDPVGGGVLVLMDGHAQSYVDLADASNLGFEYLQHMACVLDCLPGGPLAVTHIGGGGLSMARYLHATHPGSTQVVIEPDSALTDLIRRELPLPRGHRIRIRATDGVSALTGLRSGSASVIILDAFHGGRVPAELTTADYWAQACAVLRPSGLALLNLADEPGLRYVARVIAGLASHLPYLALIAGHEVLKNRRFGNCVVAASRRPLPILEIQRRLARAPFPGGIREGAGVTRLVRSARPFHGNDTAKSPLPPQPGRWRRR